MIAMTSKCRDKNEPSKQSSHQMLLPHLTEIYPSHMEAAKWSCNPFTGEEESVEFEEALLQSNCNCKSIPTVKPTSKHSPWYHVQPSGTKIKSRKHWTSLLSPKKIWASFPSRPPNKSTGTTAKVFARDDQESDSRSIQKPIFSAMLHQTEVLNCGDQVCCEGQNGMKKHHSKR